MESDYLNIIEKNEPLNKESYPINTWCGEQHGVKHVKVSRTKSAHPNVVHGHVAYINAGHAKVGYAKYFEFLPIHNKKKLSLQYLDGATEIIIQPFEIVKENIEKQFNELSSKWKKETSGYSTTNQIVSNNNYLEIISLGSKYTKDIVLLILQDLKKERRHWFVALNIITKDDPVSDKEFGSIEKMRQAWLRWGEQKGLI